jgi:hypothetical protein
VGWFQLFSVYGLNAVDVGSNIGRLNRTSRQSRLDGREDYSLVFHPSGYKLNPDRMPWRAIGKMDDQELGAIYAYLKNLPDS